MAELKQEKNKEKLDIYINDQKFNKETGVKHNMTGEELASLVDIPVKDAGIREESNPDHVIKADEKIKINDGDHFIIYHKDHFHIFINHRKFTKKNGAKHNMTGADFATLVEIPSDNAVVRYKDTQEEIGINQTIHVKNSQHFLVTRKNVEGGHE